MNPTLLVLAAGMGSRYGGLKQLDPMGPNGETLLDYSVYDALRAGYGGVTFVIRRAFEQVFRERVCAKYESRTPVRFVFQELEELPDGLQPPAGRERPWGTAHAVWCARETVREPFVAINADDFYGAEAYRQMAAFLRDAPPEEGARARFAMVGYRLRNTVSEHGAVARGVCEVDREGNLTDVVEQLGIEPTPTGAQQKNPDGTVIPYTGDEVVSMNFWGFTPRVFPMLESILREFLREHRDSPKAEVYVSTSVSQLIASGAATVAVLPTGGRWFGVTYREDKPRVEQAIRELIASGEYPARLF